MEKEYDPIKAQMPQADKIKCRDCKNRDKACVDINGKRILVGVTKSFCAAYADGVGKPYDVLFQNVNCKYYEKDGEA